MLSTTVLLRTGLPEMWLTAVYVALNNLLLLAIGLEIYFKVFSMLAVFLTKKIVFVKFVDASFFVNFDH